MVKEKSGFSDVGSMGNASLKQLEKLQRYGKIK